VSAAPASTHVRPARPGEAPRLSELALRSKAYWGYDPEFLERCRTELEVRPEQLAALRAHVLEREGSILGFFTLAGAPPEGELVHLYVDPAAIGAGVGGTLFRAASEIARREGFDRPLIHGDPNAQPFYSRQRARQIGEVPSGSIPGRLLPLLAVELPLVASARRGSIWTKT
jgi:GNAT superfamily N-acetyltransferase